jgi:signal transduction histidine kinase
MQGVVKPVKTLTAAAQRVAAGDFEAAVPIKRQDEIGQLSTAFYAMTQELAKSRDELVLRNEELKAYTAYVVRAQEEERQRMARELHDDTIQSLLLLCRRLDGLQGVGESPPTSTFDRLQEAREIAEEVVTGLRDFTKTLRPPILDDLGMVTSVRRLLTDLTERTKIKSQLRVAGEDRRLPPDTELGIFRIAQEALRNTERHAEATRIAVTLTFTKDEVRLEVIDNGVGFSRASVSNDFTASGHLGLISMQERAELLGGRLKIKSSPGNGTRVNASVPVADSLVDAAMNGVE